MVENGGLDFELKERPLNFKISELKSSKNEN